MQQIESNEIKYAPHAASYADASPNEREQTRHATRNVRDINLSTPVMNPQLDSCESMVSSSYSETHV